MRIRRPIVLFGDSITQYGFGDSPLGDPVRVGWAALLSSTYQRRTDVLNRGFSGYNTNHALEMVPRVFGGSCGEHKPLFCTVFFGANDATLPSNTSDSGRQHVPIEQYASNLKSIVTSIRGAIGDDKLPILILTPPPVDEERWKSILGIYDHCDRSNEAARKYGEMAKSVAALFQGCPVVDTWALLGGNDLETYKSHLCDGLHLSDSGNQLVYEGIMETIQANFPHLMPADPEEDVGIHVEEPLWTELC